jgi:hypothetical protein
MDLWDGEDRSGDDDDMGRQNENVSEDVARRLILDLKSVVPVLGILSFVTCNYTAYGHRGITWAYCTFKGL